MQGFASATVLIALALLDVGYAGYGFVKTGYCENDQVCVYQYMALQQDFEDEVQLNFSVTTKVQVSCDAVGQYGESEAIRYCMKFTDTKIFLNGFEETGDDAGSGDNDMLMADEVLAGRFCFVQDESGKIVAATHLRDENPVIVNFKKGVAAAFQSNFKHSKEQEEDDPQSTHRSHYSYQDREDGSTVVHRGFSNEDILEYPSRVPIDSVDLVKDEYLTYRSGVLQQSTGDVSVKITSRGARPGTSGFRSPGKDQAYDGSFHANKFSARGSYQMDLEYCFEMSRDTARQRRETEEDGEQESALLAADNKTSDDMYRLQQLRQTIPSVHKALVALHSSPSDSHLVYSLQQLLELEAQYGASSGSAPALDQVLEYLEKIQDSVVQEDRQMRVVIYALLSTEGSNHAQMALYHAMEVVNEEKERNTLVTFLAFVPNPSFDLVLQLEKQLDNSATTDPLLLAYGALASTASLDLKHHIVEFLKHGLAAAQGNPLVLAHILHSLGNTGCKTTVFTFLHYLNHTNEVVRLAAINGLRKHTSDRAVQTAFVTMLNYPGTADEDLIAIVHSLLFGLEHEKVRGTDNTLFIAALASLAVRTTNTHLQQLVMNYISLLSTHESNYYLKILETKAKANKDQVNTTTTRNRRGSDWDESNSVYNLVASQTSRSNDVRVYPHHRAYIWGKYIGVSDLNCQVAAGGFVGVDADGSHFKLFGKAVAQGHAFGETRTALEAQLLLEKENTDWHAILQATIAGRVLINYERRVSLAWNYDWPLYSSPQYTLINFEYPIFIYVGFLRFNIRVYAEFGIVANGQAAVDVITSASAAIIPKVTLTGEASATASLLELVRGGIRARASLNYQVEPRLTSRFCIPRLAFQNCIGVYDEWPDSHVDIFAFYQHRIVRWCTGWFGVSYPCGFDWGQENRWDAASVQWNLPGRGRTTLYNVCDYDLPQCLLFGRSARGYPILSHEAPKEEN